MSKKGKTTTRALGAVPRHAAKASAPSDAFRSVRAKVVEFKQSTRSGIWSQPPTTAP